MLTHGWRRFNWDYVAAGKFPKINYPKDTSYLTLSGKIYGGLPSQLRDAGSIIIIMRKEKHDNKMVVVAIEPNGTFTDPSVILFDTTSIFTSFRNQRDSVMLQFNLWKTGCLLSLRILQQAEYLIIK